MEVKGGMGEWWVRMGMWNCDASFKGTLVAWSHCRYVHFGRSGREGRVQVDRCQIRLVLHGCTDVSLARRRDVSLYPVSGLLQATMYHMHASTLYTCSDACLAHPDSIVPSPQPSRCLCKRLPYP